MHPEVTVWCTTTTPYRDRKQFKTQAAMLASLFNVSGAMHLDTDRAINLLTSAHTMNVVDGKKAFM